MRATLVCFDTRGGIQPYVGLGLGLRAAGHDVRFVTTESYRSFVTAAGLEFQGVAGDLQGFMRDPETLKQMEKGFWATHRLMVSKTTLMLKEWMRDLVPALEGSDVLIAGFGGMLAGESVAEKLGIPLVQAHVQPLTTTSEYPGLLSIPETENIGVFNRLSHFMSRQVFWQPLRGAVNQARKNVLGLPPARFASNIGRPASNCELVLHGYSPSLLPAPGDWDSRVHVTGYWFLDQRGEWMPPSGLEEFLAAGPPPVAVGFGSMSSRDAEATARLVLDAVEAAGERVVLLSGWGGMDVRTLPDWAYLTDAIPHEKLFPRCSLAVHHGGAGTTGAALRAGIPSVIVPFGADQPFWARLLAKRGLGTSPGPRKFLTSDRLRDSISRTISDSAMRLRAGEMGERIRAENGVAAAVRLIESLPLRTTPA